MNGTGLGLAIAKWIAGAHGATLSVESREGHGSVFTVEFRARAERALPTGAAESSGQTTRNLQVT